jgi:hypothetical protein
MHQMRMTIGPLVDRDRRFAAAHVVVVVGMSGRAQAAEKVFEILEQELLRFVDSDRGRGVARKNRHHALADIRVLEVFVDVIGQVDKLDRLAGSNTEQNVGHGHGLGAGARWMRNNPGSHQVAHQVPRKARHEALVDRKVREVRVLSMAT